MADLTLLHFSEDPAIEVFHPHVPATNPDAEPMVWAIDDEHAPLYWFPRDCPRVTFWRGPDPLTPAGEHLLAHTGARRVHAIEGEWLGRLRAVTLFAYRFDAAPFDRWPEADGHFVARTEVTPLAVEPVGDLLARHAAAGIELRITPSLWPLRDAVVESGLRFSTVRMGNAEPRASMG